MTATLKLGRWLTSLLLAAALATPERTLRAGTAYTWQGPGNIWSRRQLEPGRRATRYQCHGHRRD